LQQKRPLNAKLHIRGAGRRIVRNEANSLAPQIRRSAAARMLRSAALTQEAQRQLELVTPVCSTVALN
jgi:hypothetical protein